MIKVVFFGTSEFAIPTLRKLHESDFIEIVSVVTQPDKPAGRKQVPLPSPIKVWAMDHGLKILQPEKLTADGLLHGADLFIVASYGQIIPEQVLSLPKFGTLNTHPSLLPKYRGPSPIQTAILNDDDETGVTIMLMDEKVDHGALIASSKVKIQNPKVKYQELHDELAEIGADLLISALPKYLAGELKPVEQDHSKATFTKPIEKRDGMIDWGDSAENIDRKVRAFHIWPVAWTKLEGKRLKIYSSIPHSDTLSNNSKPGEISIQENKIFVQCGSGRLEILELQLEGARKLQVSDFLHGNKDLETKILGS